MTDKGWRKMRWRGKTQVQDKRKGMKRQKDREGRGVE